MPVARVNNLLLYTVARVQLDRENILLVLPVARVNNLLSVARVPVGQRKYIKYCTLYACGQKK